MLKTITTIPDFQSGSIPSIIKMSQYDTSFEIVFDLSTFDQVSLVTSARVEGTKSDNTGFSKACTLDAEGKTATLTGDVQMTVLPNYTEYELVLLDSSGTRLGSTNFRIYVEPAALSSDTEVSETEIPAIIALAEKQEAAAGASASAASASAAAAGTSEMNAKKTADSSQSWAIGGTGTRDGENNDNSKYYSEQAKQSVNVAENAFINWCALHRTGKVYSTKFYYFSTNTTSAGIKMDANENLSASPSTDSTEGTDDYENIPVFQWWHCNYKRDDDGYARPYSLEGDTDYKNTGNVDVGSLNMTFYWAVEDHLADGYYILHVSDTPHPELNLVPWVDAVKQDGTVMPYYIVSSYASVVAPDTYLRSIQGQPAYNQSYQNMISAYPKKGTGYHGAGACRNTFGYIFLAIKYGTKNVQKIMAGCSSYNNQVAVALAETSAKRVLVAAQGAFVVGGTVSVGDIGTNTSIDRQNGYMHNIADRVRIASIESVTIESTSYIALNLDIDADITTTATTYVSAMPAYSGWTDDVIGHKDGSPVSNTDGKHPFRIKGVEFLNGQYAVASDTVLAMQADFNHKVYTCDRWDTRLTSAVEDSYSLTGIIPGADSAGADFWEGDLALDTPTGAWYPSSVGTSDSLGIGDRCYGVSGTSGYREYLQSGYLGHGSTDGFGCLCCWYGLSLAPWSFASCD